MKIYIYQIGRTINVPPKVYNLLVVYKMFFPPNTKIQLGKSKTIKVKDYELKAPPEQLQMVNVEPTTVKHEQRMD